MIAAFAAHIQSIGYTVRLCGAADAPTSINIKLPGRSPMIYLIAGDIIITDGAGGEMVKVPLSHPDSLDRILQCLYRQALLDAKLVCLASVLQHGSLDYWRNNLEENIGLIPPPIFEDAKSFYLISGLDEVSPIECLKAECDCEPS